ncbi:MAG: histidine triad nucleotide-binding protein [Oscillospiraceae bacterium]|nr:histidine triad nucleotide-binding protein [Oscillospiraceae bacterium]
MSDCLFCKIAAGEIPSTAVYEDEDVFAFRDINPQAPTHILVIPREHIGSVAEIGADNAALAAKCLEAVAKIAEQEHLDSGFRVISNCGPDAGQTVFHLHFHILAGKPMGEKLV